MAPTKQTPRKPPSLAYDREWLRHEGDGHSQSQHSAGQPAGSQETARSNVNASHTLENGRKTVKELQSFCVYAADVFEKQAGQIDRIFGAVERLQDDMSVMKDSMEGISQEVMEVRAKPTQSSRDPTGKLELSIDETELLTNNIAKIGQKASEVDGLKMQLEMMRNRLRRLESAQTTAAPTPPLPVRESENGRARDLSQGIHQSRTMSMSSAPRPQQTANFFEAGNGSGPSTEPPLRKRKIGSALVGDATELHPSRASEQYNIAASESFLPAQPSNSDSRTPGATVDLTRDAETTLGPYQVGQSGRRAAERGSTSSRRHSRNYSRPRTSRAPDPFARAETPNFVAPYDDPDDNDYRPAYNPTSTPGSRGGSVRGRGRGRGRGGGRGRGRGRDSSGALGGVRQTVLSPTSQRLALLDRAPEDHGAGDPNGHVEPNLSSPSSSSSPPRSVDPFSTGLRRQSAEVRRNEHGQRLKKNGELDRRSLRYVEKRTSHGAGDAGALPQAPGVIPRVYAAPSAPVQTHQRQEEPTISAVGGTSEANGHGHANQPSIPAERPPIAEAHPAPAVEPEEDESYLKNAIKFAAMAT